jgi:hypothetical protein
MANAPLIGRDSESIKLCLPNREAKYFCKDDLTGNSPNCPSGKSVGLFEAGRPKFKPSQKANGRAVNFQKVANDNARLPNDVGGSRS